MGTSASYDWTLSRTQVITGALRKLAVLPSGGAPSAAQTSDSAEALNALVKAFAADGMPLWAITSNTWTVVSGTASYTIGPSKTLNVAAAPLKVIQAHRTPLGGTDIQMNVYNRHDFDILPDTATGTPISVYYHPITTAGVATGIIYLWPTPIESTTTVTIDFQRPFDDMDNDADNFDFPAYWMNALIFNLAWVLAPEYGIPMQDRADLEKYAKYWHEYALSMGSEEGSIYMQPNTQGK